MEGALGRGSFFHLEPRPPPKLSVESYSVGKNIPGHTRRPVRTHAVILVHLRRPARVGHRGPMLVVEARRRIEPLALDVEHEALAIRIELQGAPGHRVEPLADPEHAAAPEHGIGDPTARHVEDDVGEGAELLIVAIHDRVARERLRGNDLVQVEYGCAVHCTSTVRWLSIRMTPSSRCACAEAMAACSRSFTVPVRVTTPRSVLTEMSEPARALSARRPARKRAVIRASEIESSAARVRCSGFWGAGSGGRWATLGAGDDANAGDSGWTRPQLTAASMISGASAMGVFFMGPAPIATSLRSRFQSRRAARVQPRIDRLTRNEARMLRPRPVPRALALPGPGRGRPRLRRRAIVVAIVRHVLSAPRSARRRGSRLPASARRSAPR